MSSTALRRFEEFAEHADKCIILQPTETVMTSMNPFLTIYANVLRVDLEADTYEVDGGKRAPNARFINRVAAGAGINFLHATRLDDGRDASLAHATVLAEMRRPDGSMIRTTGSKRVSALAYVAQKYGADWKSSDKAVKFYTQFCKFVAERAETGAKVRAVRGLLGMKASYTVDELRKPFIIPQIQMNAEAIAADPDGRRMLLASAVGAIGTVFGNGNGAAPALPAPAEEAPRQIEAPEIPADDDDFPVTETIDMETGEVIPMPEEAPAQASTPFDGPIFDPTPAPEPKAKPAAKPAPKANGKAAGKYPDVPTCPECDGPMWDNRVGKKNPKAPDFKCKDKACDGLYWAGQWPPKDGGAAPAVAIASTQELPL